jgi:hypothetical protein
MKLKDKLKTFWMKAILIFCYIQGGIIVIIGGLLTVILPLALNLAGFPLAIHWMADNVFIGGIKAILYVVFIGVGSVKFFLNFGESGTPPFWKYVVGGICSIYDKPVNKLEYELQVHKIREKNKLDYDKDYVNPNKKLSLLDKIKIHKNKEIFNRVYDNFFLSYDSYFHIQWDRFGDSNSWYRCMNYKDYRLSLIKNPYVSATKKYKENKKLLFMGKCYGLVSSPQNPYKDNKVHSQYDFVFYDLYQESKRKPNVFAQSIENNVDGVLYEILAMLQIISCKDFDEYFYYNLHFPITKDNVFEQAVNQQMENLLFWMYIDQAMTVDFIDIHTLHIEDRFILMINQLHKMHLLFTNNNFISSQNSFDCDFLYNELEIGEYEQSLIALVEKVPKIEESIKNLPHKDNVPLMLEKSQICSDVWLEWYQSKRKDELSENSLYHEIAERFTSSIFDKSTFLTAIVVEDTKTKKRQLYFVGEKILFMLDSDENNNVLYDEIHYTMDTYLYEQTSHERDLNTINDDQKLREFIFKKEVPKHIYTDFKRVCTFFNPKYVKFIHNLDNLNYMISNEYKAICRYEFQMSYSRFLEDTQKEFKETIERFREKCLKMYANYEEIYLEIYNEDKNQNVNSVN